MKAINGYFWEPVGNGGVLEDSVKVSDTVSHDTLTNDFRLRKSLILSFVQFWIPHLEKEIDKLNEI